MNLYLNTSHVNLNQYLKLNRQLYYIYLNTSHVNLNQEQMQKNAAKMAEFKYISC